MDLIQMTRELAKAMQQDERFIRLHKAQEIVEQDTALQNDIADFNEKRYELSIEVTKGDRDDEKVTRLDAEVRRLYDSITGSEKMLAYNDAQEDFDEVYRFMEHIIQKAYTGADPDTVDESSMQSECTGSCESCGGCH